MVSKKQKRFVSSPGDKVVPILFNKELYEQLRKYCFEHNVSMAQVCREGVELFFKKTK